MFEFGNINNENDYLFTTSAGFSCLAVYKDTRFHDVDFRVALDSNSRHQPSALCYHFAGVLRRNLENEFHCTQGIELVPGEGWWMLGTEAFLLVSNQNNYEYGADVNAFEIAELQVIGIEF